MILVELGLAMNEGIQMTVVIDLVVILEQMLLELEVHIGISSLIYSQNLLRHFRFQFYPTICLGLRHNSQGCTDCRKAIWI